MRILLVLLSTVAIAFALWAPVPSSTELCPMGMTAAEMSAMAQPGGQDPPSEGQNPPEEGPEGNPTHQEPMDFCYNDKPSDGKGVCMCLMNRPGACSPDRANEEVRSCNSWCWKMKWCHCCKS